MAASSIQLSDETSSCTSNGVKSSCANYPFKHEELSDLKYNYCETSSIFESDNSVCNNWSRSSLRNKISKDTPAFNVAFVDRFNQSSSSSNKCFNRIVSSGSSKGSNKILKGGTAIMRYLKSQESFEVQETKINHIELFKIFQYLNDRLILLNVIDKKQEDNSKLNEKYISAYNSFMVPVTFHALVYVNTYGGFKFYRGENIYTMKSYLFKKGEVNTDNIHSLDKSNHLLLHEAKLLARIKHPNIVNYFKSWIEYQVVYIQLEDPYGINIKEMLTLRGKDKYSDRRRNIADEFILKMISEILSAIYYLFDNQICVHRNVMANNVWVKCHTVQLQWNSLSDISNKGYISFVLFNFENAIRTSVPDRLKLLNGDISAVRIIALQMLYDSTDTDMVETWQENVKTKTDNTDLQDQLEILKDYF